MSWFVAKVIVMVVGTAAWLGLGSLALSEGSLFAGLALLGVSMNYGVWCLDNLE